MTPKDLPTYPEQDHILLGEHYLRHVDAMTREGLHAKSAIAAQLAWRDAEIERLRGELGARSTAAQPADEMVTIPRSALRWLFGEEGEFECPARLYFRGKPPGYWWRTVFREKIAAPPAAAQPVEPIDRSNDAAAVKRDIVSMLLAIINDLDDRAMEFDKSAHPFNDKFGDHPEKLHVARACAELCRDLSLHIRKTAERPATELHAAIDRLVAPPAASGDLPPPSEPVQRSST